MCASPEPTPAGVPDSRAAVGAETPGPRAAVASGTSKTSGSAGPLALATCLSAILAVAIGTGAALLLTVPILVGKIGPDTHPGLHAVPKPNRLRPRIPSGLGNAQPAL